MAEILLVEDDATLGMSLELALGDHGHTVRWRRTLADARAALLDRPADLVVLDLGLPDGDGLALCRELRAVGDAVPIVILTARGTVSARVEGLSLGADDYVTKPFDVDELLARIDAKLRRTAWQRQTPHLRVGRLEVDFRTRAAWRDGEPIELTDLELRLLRYLASRAGEPVHRERLLSDVWGIHPKTRTRTVDMYASRLRRHIEHDPSHPRHLLGVRGVGYRLVLDPEP